LLEGVGEGGSAGLLPSGRNQRKKRVDCRRHDGFGGLEGGMAQKFKAERQAKKKPASRPTPPKSERLVQGLGATTGAMKRGRGA